MGLHDGRKWRRGRHTGAGLVELITLSTSEIGSAGGKGTGEEGADTGRKLIGGHDGHKVGGDSTTGGKRGRRSHREQTSGKGRQQCEHKRGHRYSIIIIIIKTQRRRRNGGVG